MADAGARNAFLALATAVGTAAAAYFSGALGNSTGGGLFGSASASGGGLASSLAMPSSASVGIGQAASSASFSQDAAKMAAQAARIEAFAAGGTNASSSAFLQNGQAAQAAAQGMAAAAQKALASPAGKALAQDLSQMEQQALSSSAFSKLSAADQQALQQVVGQLTPERLSALGSEPGKLFDAMEKLLPRPDAVKALLDDPNVVKGLLSQKRVQTLCQDAQAFANYLSNKADSTGIRRSGYMLAASFGIPSGTVSMMESKAFGALSKCNSVQAFTANPAMISQVIASNPQILSILTNPEFLKGLASNPAAGGIAGALKGLGK
ncbi:MAG TPA: hypothetical protein VNI01_15495 [Elusimicrobiota bacterium]|nr:hypothetical protein [Elusimicrobiota bacterium]